MYKTRILVSERVYQAAKDGFVFRYLDHITAAGMNGAIKIYELMGAQGMEPPFDLARYETEFEVGLSAYLASGFA